VNLLVNPVDPNPIVKLVVNPLEALSIGGIRDRNRSTRFTTGFSMREFDQVYDEVYDERHGGQR
jgi:hypothetical protein